MTEVHLEGLGVVGCYLAHRLYADGIPFTWHDTDEPVTAWRACTGAIFPTGHAEDQQAMAVWQGHLDDPVFAPHMEEGAYVFCTKAPPHGARYGWEQLPGDAKLAEVRSLHLNAQTWVPWTRERFASLNTGLAPELGAFVPDDTEVVVTHGFGERLARFMWGWTQPIRLLTTVDEGPGLRPCIYFRRGRFTMAYAYPIPGTELWYAGSSLISQRAPKNLAVLSKWQRWRKDFLELGDGYVLGVAPVGKPVEGWRPVPAEGDTAWLTRQADGTLAAKPCWHSGVRHAPHIYNALLEALHGT